MPSMPFPLQSISSIINTEDSTQRAAFLVELAKILKTTELSFLVGDLETRNVTSETKLDSIITDLGLKADKTETQPVSNSTLLTELQLKANKTETQPVSNSGLLTELQLKINTSDMTFSNSKQSVNIFGDKNAKCSQENNGALMSSIRYVNGVAINLNDGIPTESLLFRNALNYTNNYSLASATFYTAPANTKAYIIMLNAGLAATGAEWFVRLNSETLYPLFQLTDKKPISINSPLFLQSTQYIYLHEVTGATGLSANMSYIEITE